MFPKTDASIHKHNKTQAEELSEDISRKESSSLTISINKTLDSWGRNSMFRYIPPTQIEDRPRRAAKQHKLTKHSI